MHCHCDTGRVYRKLFLRLLKPFWSEHAIYTDVGSTKSNVVAAAERVFGAVPDNLVPAHPIAGAEQSGVEAAVDDLFLNKRLIITPLSNTRPEALQKIQCFWEQCGFYGIGDGCTSS